MKLFGTPIVVLMALTSFVLAVPLNLQQLPSGHSHAEERNALPQPLPVKERITLTDA
jgi:hypothetical protein